MVLLNVAICLACFADVPRLHEHIFPTWLNRYLPEDRVQHLEQTRYGDNGFERQRRSIGLDFTVRKVCSRCNNEWMSRLETEAIPVLHPLISSVEVQLLTTTQQRKVAVWAVKTSMMLDQTQTVPCCRRCKLPDCEHTGQSQEGREFGLEHAMQSIL